MNDYTLQNIWFVDFSTSPTAKEIADNRTWRQNHRFAVATDTCEKVLQEILHRWPDAKVTSIQHHGKVLIEPKP